MTSEAAGPRRGQALKGVLSCDLGKGISKSNLCRRLISLWRGWKSEMQSLPACDNLVEEIKTYQKEAGSHAENHQPGGHLKFYAFDQVLKSF